MDNRLPARLRKAVIRTRAIPLAVAAWLWLLMLPISILPAPGAVAAPLPEDFVGITEHLGGSIPLDLVFRDEAGKEVTLGEMITGPTIILPVYYRCTNVCFILQGRVAGALPTLGQRPVDDYRVISVSFDETEPPAMAARSRQAYLGAMKGEFPPAGWRFLTGDAANIRRLTDALGFGFRRQGNDFMHPVASIVVTGKGTIVRYLYGVTVLPKDLALAITEARSGITGSSIRKVMDYCFSYDPVGKTYVFNLLRVSATVVILCAGGFLAFLLLGGKKRSPPSTGKP